MNSTKQCVNSEPMWGYCSRAEKKTENMDVRKRGMQTVTITTNNSFVECMLLKIYEIYIYIYIYIIVLCI